MRKRFSIILTVLVVGVIMASGCGSTLRASERLSETPTGGGWLAGWLYRKAHNITGTSAGLQVNSPVSLCVHFDYVTDFDGAKIFRKRKL